MTTKPKRIAKPKIIRDMEKSYELAHKHVVLGQEIAKWFQERYGVEPGDVDCDPIIDCIDYATNTAPRSIYDIDREMALCGVYPLEARD